jgi:TRAP-type C4-dicarboxylate transport system permease small subunit
VNNIIEKTSKTLGDSVRFLALIGGYVLIWVMLITVVAVVTRKVFSAPIEGIQDLSEASLLVVVFSSLAYAGWTGAHIAVDILSTFLKGRASNYLDGVTRFVSAVFFAVIAWQTIDHGLDALEYGEAYNMLPIPFYPFYFFVAFGTGLFSLILFLQSVRSLNGIADYKGR